MQHTYSNVSTSSEIIPTLSEKEGAFQANFSCKCTLKVTWAEGEAQLCTFDEF